MTKALCLILLASRASALLAQGPSECGNNLNQLVVGSDFGGDIGYVPFETEDDEEIVGFDASVACEVAHRLGFGGVSFRQVPFPDLLTTLTATPSGIDVVISAMSITQPRVDTPGVAFVKYNNDSLGIVFNTADVEPAFENPATVLQALNQFGVDNDEDIVIAATAGSRQIDIINNDAYTNLAVSVFDTLEEALESLIDPSTATFALFVDGATAVTVAAADGDLFALNNVVDTTNTAVSQGLGIAVNAECCQLYANIQQAINDMNADGTLARLRAEFPGVPTGFTPANGLTPAACANTAENIDSNSVANYLFSKYCPCVVPVVI